MRDCELAALRVMRCVMPAYQHAQVNQRIVCVADTRARMLLTVQLQHRTELDRTAIGDRLDRIGIGDGPDISCVGLHLLSMSVCLQSQVIKAC